MGKKFYLVSRCKKTFVGLGDGPLGASDPLLDPSIISRLLPTQCSWVVTLLPDPNFHGSLANLQSPTHFQRAHWLVSIQIGVYSIDSSWRRYQDICDNNNILYQIWMAEKVLLQHSDCFEKFPKNLFEAYFYFCVVNYVMNYLWDKATWGYYVWCQAKITKFFKKILQTNF